MSSQSSRPRETFRSLDIRQKGRLCAEQGYRQTWSKTVKKRSVQSKWSDVFLEQLICSQSKYFLCFMESEILSPCWQDLCHWSSPWTRHIYSQHPILFLLRFTFILSSHLPLGFPSGLIPSGFFIGNLWVFILLAMLPTCSAAVIVLA